MSRRKLEFPPARPATEGPYSELHLTQSTAGNGIVTTQDFDPDTGLIKEQRAGPVTGPNWNSFNWASTVPPGANWGGPSVAAFSYSFDAIGRLTSRSDYETGVTDRFCYDSTNQLTNSATGKIGVSTCTSSGAGITTKSVGYDLLANITSKSDVGTYSYAKSGPTSTLPHAISSIAGTAGGLTNPVFEYDDNGNLTCMYQAATGSCTGTRREITYTSFNMTATIADLGNTLTLTYDSEHARIRQSSTISGTTTVTDYLNDPASGAMSQRIKVGSGTPSFVDYISADGLIVAQKTTTYSTTAMWGVAQWNTTVPPGFNWGGVSSVPQWSTTVPPGFNWGSADWGGTVTPPTVDYRYFINDHLGSVAVVTDDALNIVRLSYDAWGKQRNATTGADAACGTITSPTTKGFTNQEQMPGSCLVNLSARLYDSEIGKFLTPDPVVGDIFVLNGFNPYAYVLNNPLSFTDPTGLCFLGCFWKSGIFKAIVAIAVAVVFQQWGVIPALLGESAAFATSAIGMIVNGAILGGITGGISGGTLKSIGLGMFQGALFAQAGNLLDVDGVTLLGSSDAAAFIAHGLVGGIVSVAGGGDFGSGFLAGGISSLGSASFLNLHDVAANTAIHALLGGIGAELGGGKFANGAATGAFGYLFNAEAHKLSRKACVLASGGCNFSVRENPSANPNAPLHESGRFSMVNEFDASINRVAAETGVGGDLIRAIMYVETTHGWYDEAFSWFGLNSSLRPMNINTNYWGASFGTRSDLQDPYKNISAGARMLSGIIANFSQPASIAAIGTLYNDLSATHVSNYGARVQSVYNSKPWNH